MLTPFLAAAAFIVTFLLAGTFLGYFSQGEKKGPFALPRRFNYLDNLTFDLKEAGIEMSAMRFTVIWTLIGFISAGTLWYLGFPIIATFGGLIGGVVLPRQRLSGNAQKRRLMILTQVGEASADMANQIRQGKSADQAMASIASRADPAAQAANLLPGSNQVAKSLNLARRRVVTGVAEPIALTEAARGLGSRYFANMIQAYVANKTKNQTEQIKALEGVAQEVAFTLSLRRERIAAISQPLNSYKMVGGVIAGLLLYNYAVTPGASLLFKSDFGQILLIFMFGWWYLGYWLQRRDLNDRV